MAKNTQSYLQTYDATANWSIGIALKRWNAGERSQLCNVAPSLRQMIKSREEKATYFGERDMGAFEKETLCLPKRYLPEWTEEVFVILSWISGIVPTYKVQEWDGTQVDGTFYAQDFQPVTVLDDGLFHIQ